MPKIRYGNQTLKNMFLFTSVNCIAYESNLAALKATKCTNYKYLSAEIDALVNSSVAYFKIVGKKKCALNRIF